MSKHPLKIVATGRHNLLSDIMTLSDVRLSKGYEGVIQYFKTPPVDYLYR